MLTSCLVKKFFAFFVCFRSGGGTFVHELSSLLGRIEDQVVQEGDEQTHQSQRYAGDAGILGEEEATQEERQKLRTADYVDGHRETRGPAGVLPVDAQSIGDPGRQIVHKSADGFGAKMQSKEHRNSKNKELNDLR